MKINLICKEDDYEKYAKELISGEIILTKKDAEFLLIENGVQNDSIIGKYKEEFKIIKPEDILYIESYGNDVFAVTLNENYLLREKLYEMEYIFFQKGFIRVSKSYVINVNHIQSIKPSFNMKFTLKMKNNVFIDVTRSYYYRFKEFIGL